MTTHYTFHSNPMANNFSFPATTKTEYSNQFEFERVTSTPLSPHSPADHFFSNGKLLPHVFPNNNNFSYSRSTSSKDSLMSSRSNSRNSNCSSARMSTSEASERNRFPLRTVSDGIIPGRKSVGRERKLSTCQYQHGSSQRWQFIAGAPVLNHQGSKSRKVEKTTTIHQKEPKNEGDGEKPWFGGRILKSFVSACKECHAIKTSPSTMASNGVLPTSLEV